jgi:sugar-specific transcriptional regulator TrmB
MPTYYELYYQAYTPNELLDFIIKCKRDIEYELRKYNLKEQELDPDRTHVERGVLIIMNWKNKAIEKLNEVLK